MLHARGLVWCSQRARRLVVWPRGREGAHSGVGVGVGGMGVGEGGGKEMQALLTRIGCAGMGKLKKYNEGRKLRKKLVGALSRQPKRIISGLKGVRMCSKFQFDRMGVDVYSKFFSVFVKCHTFFLSFFFSTCAAIGK